MYNKLIDDCLLYVLIIMSIGLIIWGLRYRKRFCQYPFLMGFTFITFLLPQAIGLINNPEVVPQRAVQQTLIMSCLCALMCWLGYQIKIPKKCLQKPSLQVDKNKLKIGAFIYACIGYIFWILVYSRPEAASLNQYWTGIITVYVFFANLLNIGFTILLLETIKQPKISNLLLLFIPSSILMYRVIFAGRRTTMVFIAFSIVCAFYFIKNQTTPRKIIILGLLIGTLIISSIHDYRMLVRVGEWNKITEINPIQNLQAVVKQENQGMTLELRNAALVIDTVTQTGRYEWGSRYWNTLVFKWIPAQFLGSEFKKQLQLNLDLDYFDIWHQYYGYKHPKGSTSTGIGDSFSQFDYFGCLIFGIFAYFFKYLWYRSCNGDYILQILYILLIPTAMTSLTHNTANFLPELLYYMIFSSPLIIFSIKKNHYILNAKKYTS
ncbi:hypothetical protein IQ247_12160 [Plectonema cf. radiosum LEGE 06105]|uniref:Oligosaccharide repeat unit polymerase n=1 Tax=Plectonema cf. radiosum LEGE 06105 TaxID=945769 RepID=A0A8J7F4L7_9CYAN|nr:hypothetical protein [Plectonema radiosum]MBE9213410.1 hypothetical protein [Plectonema cf. radiosum LEGE 06105]